MSAGLEVLDQRPRPGAPRAYDFPAFERSRLPNGLEVIRAHVPGRPLLQAQLVVRGGSGGGATSEPPGKAGITLLTARAMAEGTRRRSAVELIEAAERLGAELAAEASWDALIAHVEVPRGRLGPALALLAEMALQPSFPEHEVARLRDERLNDLRQGMAEPRRRVERAFAATIYAPDAAFARPMGGDEITVPGLDREDVVARHAALLRPGACTLIVAGDLDDVPLDDLVGDAFGVWEARGEPPSGPTPASDRSAVPRRIVIVDRPGAPQTEVRVGHVGSARRIEDFHALSVSNALLGGLFNSRLNRLLREERGFTYGVHSSFDLRREAGPFAVRCAVASDVTVPAIVDIMSELERIRQAPADGEELAAARDYLVGVFPLRFETSAQVAAALAGLVIHDLPDDELDRYRPTIAAVSAEAAHEAATRHIAPERASIVVVGDASVFRTDLEAAGLGDVEIVEDEGFEGPSVRRGDED